MLIQTSLTSCASFVVNYYSVFAQSDQEQDEEYETEEQLQARILTAALEFVPLHGWSMEAISAGAEVRFKQLPVYLLFIFFTSSISS